MTSVAIVAEGLTDQIIINFIIDAVVLRDDLLINPLQPSRDKTDAYSAPHGGWEKVFEFCQSRLEDALITNDYVVIHIDTDCGDHENFDLGITDNGVEKTYSRLVDETRNIINDRIGEDILARHPNKIIYAIAVHSLESWLLLILYDDKNVHGGEKRLRHYLHLAGKRFDKTPEIYFGLAKKIKRKRLKHLDGSKNSFGLFLAELKAV